MSFLRPARGFGLERFKGALYVLLPVAAVLVYAQPPVHEAALRSRRYVVYVDSDLPRFGRNKGGGATAGAGAGAGADDAKAAADTAASAPAAPARRGGRFGDGGGAR
jgi:hypothetical protein